MKKALVFILTSLTLATVLSGCGGGSGSSYKAESATAYDSYDSYASDDMYYSKNYIEEAMEEEAVEAPSEANVESVDDEVVNNSNRKIIKNVNIDAETEEFDAFIANIDAKVKALGGYMESTNITGRSINASRSSMRNGNITARIPAKNLDSFITEVAEQSNITNKSESAEDVTLNYADTQAHISSLRKEQERLDELLLQADSIETIIALEQRITEVRYELESYESRLRTMDNKVDYSTVYINVREVERYTPVEEVKQPVWKRIAVGFTENLIKAKDFITDAFVGIIVSLPLIAVFLLIMAIPVTILVFGIRFIIGLAQGPEYRAKKKQLRAEKKAAKAAKKAEKNVKK